MQDASNAERAERLYVEALTSSTAAQDWHDAVSLSRRRVFATLKATKLLTDVAHALRDDGTHATILRNFAGPPISQDQFGLLCPAYNRAREKPGHRFAGSGADTVAAALLSIRDDRLTRWLGAGRSPTTGELRRLVHAVAPMLSQQIVATLRRNRLSVVQEDAVTDLLTTMGWTRVTSGVVEQSLSLPLRHFMHKTRFATRTRPQEVDIACGLGKSNVLAMECKVTNDRTNSVKRINDILKKATAWQLHWGSFVRTAALLQGVIAERDVARLTAANVEVFWSHDLGAFTKWLEANLAE